MSASKWATHAPPLASNSTPTHPVCDPVDGVRFPKQGVERTEQQSNTAIVYTSTCTAHSGATKAHDWMVSVLGPLFRTA